LLDGGITEDNSRATAREVGEILSAADAPALHPQLGRKGRVPGTRELIVPPFVVAYRARKLDIELLAIIHTARRWPELF
jgi:toxin ParE1/3/4